MADDPEKDAERPPDQYAALLWRGAGERREYLLVTSRRTGRWIFPKGSAEGDEAPWEAALREAGEEAGIVGMPAGRPVGRYSTLKVSPAMARNLIVELWPVEIRRLADEYPERDKRARRLVGIAEARALLAQEDMLVLLERFHATSTG